MAQLPEVNLMEAMFYLSTVVTVGVSASCTWIAAEWSRNNIPRTVAAGSLSAFATMAACCAVAVLLRERPEFVKLTPLEEFVWFTSLFGGAAAIAGVFVGCLCLIYRRLMNNAD